MPYRVPYLVVIVFALLILATLFNSKLLYAESRLSADVIKDGAKNSGCEYDPYQKLKELGVVGANVKIGSIGVNNEGLDISLACRLSKFLEWAKQQGCNPKIISAFRSRADQERACIGVCGNAGGCTKAQGFGGGCAPPGNSCHEYGLAIDLQSSCSEKLSQAAREFKLASKVANYPNPNHYQCLEHAAGGGRSSGCKQACDGGIPINPNMDALARTGSHSPSSSIANMFRDALGLNQQPPPQPPPPPMQQQPLQQAQQPTQYFPSSQPTNTGTTGSSGGTGGTSPVSALSRESQAYLGVTQPSTYQPSISEQLLQMAYGTTTQNIPQNTGTTVPLYLNPNDIGSVRAQNQTGGSTTTQAAQYPSVGTLQPSQTFTSSDLNYAPRVQQTYTQPTTGVFAVLETLKTILLRMLEILRPMGIRNALQGGSGHIDVYAE